MAKKKDAYGRVVWSCNITVL